jgi:hypothetical protein
MPTAFAGVYELHAGIFERLADGSKVMWPRRLAPLLKIAHGG